MKRIIFFLMLCLIGYVQSYAQNDTSSITESKELKKGFYKNYKEYINNNPSIIADFTSIHYTAGKKDTTVIGGGYKLLSSDVKVKKAWGFCDGKYVFIRHNVLVDNYYWRLQVLGPHPYIMFKQKTIIASGPTLVALSQAAITAAVPAGYEIRVISKSGKLKYIWKNTMKKILADQPELLAAFNKEVKVISDYYRIKYLKLYSEAALTEKQQ